MLRFHQNIKEMNSTNRRKEVDLDKGQNINLKFKNRNRVSYLDISCYSNSKQVMQ